jgi:hypothetical protein
MYVVYLPHNPLCPLNRSRNHGVGSRATLWSTEQILCRLQVPRHKDSRQHRQRTFAALVHACMVACSPFIHLRAEDRLFSAVINIDQKFREESVSYYASCQFYAYK